MDFSVLELFCWSSEGAERHLWREEVSEAPSCTWHTGTLLASRAQSWQGSPARLQLLAHLGPGGQLPLKAPASRGRLWAGSLARSGPQSASAFQGQSRPRSFSSPPCFAPARCSWGCPWPGSLCGSQHWLQPERAPQDKAQQLRGQLKHCTAAEPSAELFGQPRTRHNSTAASRGMFPVYKQPLKEAV